MAKPAGETPPSRHGTLVASSAVRTRRLRRLPAVAVVVGVVAAVVAAITGAASPLPALSFVSPGHWVYSAVLGSAVHVDGATGSVDAGVKVAAAPDAQVVQGEGSGYVVDSGKITVFGKSDLNVSGTMAAASDEAPLTVEGAGGPYAVYQTAGKVVRLGDRPVTVLAGGRLAAPVLTGDGTMWLLRKDDGRVCELSPGADVLGSCPATVPAGHTGALSLLSGQPHYVDTTDGRLYPVGDKGFGPGTTLHAPTGAHIRPAGTDVAGRLALLDPDTHTLSLVDPNTPSAEPLTVHLPKGGDYTGPAAGGSMVTVVDRKTNTVLTYDDHGKERGHKTMPKDAGEPRLTRGDDNRVYVEGTKGTHVMVVGDDGEVADVPLNRAPARPDASDGDKKQQRVPDAPPADRDVRSGDQQEKPKPPEHDDRQQPPTQHGPEQPQPPEQPAPPPVVPASPPGAPTGVSADAGSGSATVHWSAPRDNGSAITGYHVTWRSSGTSGTRDLSAGSRSFKASGLTNGTSYTFTVAANNAAGRGTAASSKAVIPVGAASAPTVNAIYDPDEGSALVTWSAPSSLGGGTLVHYTVDATSMAQRTSAGTSMLFTNLPTDGQPVKFTVRAVTKSAGAQPVNGAPGSYTWPGSGGGSGGPQVNITRGEKICPDHEDEPTCARMHVVMTGFEPNTEYTITPHSDNDDYYADDAHYTTDGNGNRTFDTFQYYWVGDSVWVSVDVDGNDLESNHMTWKAS